MTRPWHLKVPSKAAPCSHRGRRRPRSCLSWLRLRRCDFSAGWLIAVMAAHRCWLGGSQDVGTVPLPGVGQLS
jgi:hypothetical protein